MNKIILLLYILSLLQIANSQSSCSPFGTRIQYGQILANTNSSEKAVISFNTEQPCASSYLRILGSSGFKDVACQSSQVTGSANMNFFKTYVQKCSLNNEISYDATFYYIVYGYDENSGEDAVQGKQQWIQIKMKSPNDLNSQTNILVLADWGVIKTSGVTPISQTLRQKMIQRDLNLMIVNGDIAYDLDSNNGTKYTQFLTFAQEFISKIPCVFVPGNHENLSLDDKLLLSSTFKLYNVDAELSAGLTFGNLYFVLFDPFNFVYNKVQDINSLQALKNQLIIAQASQRFVIPFSHYPLVCSGQALFCQDRLTRMYTYFNAMIDAGVSLYIGAHTHDYERTYPYFANQTFKKIQSVYKEGQGYLVSIIEGVGGSDTSMITDMSTLNSYTASYTINQTGFGILNMNPSTFQITYEHFSTTRGLTDKMIVQVSVSKVQKIKKQSNKDKKSIKNHISTQK